MERIESKDQLDQLAKEFRYIITDIMCRAGGGHIGGSLSLVEIIITLYFRILNLKPDEPRWEDRDRFILSKGHAGPTLYTALAYKGFIPKDLLLTLNANGTKLPSHVDQVITPECHHESSTGSDTRMPRFLRCQGVCVGGCADFDPNIL